MTVTSELADMASWLAARGIALSLEVTKPNPDSRAWFCQGPGSGLFAKLYPHDADADRLATEIAISSAGLHRCIVPLREGGLCREGTVLLFDRIRGESLEGMKARDRFRSLPLAERAAAVLCTCEALAAVVDAGFMIVDWYEGNMIYDFTAKQIWLFDWELCRVGAGFTLEMNSNYGSSRLMAPEEFVRGSRLDQRTLVFNVGRHALLNVPELAEPLAPVLAKATYPARTGRYGTLPEFCHALSEGLRACGLRDVS